MRANTHFIVPSERFKLLGDSNNFISTYTFGTHTAKHTFCKICGITSFYHPRSNPDGVAITFKCVDPGTLTHVEIKQFDGSNWEASYDHTGIASFSKVWEHKLVCILIFAIIYVYDYWQLIQTLFIPVFVTDLYSWVSSRSSHAIFLRNPLLLLLFCYPHLTTAFPSFTAPFRSIYLLPKTRILEKHNGAVKETQPKQKNLWLHLFRTLELVVRSFRHNQTRHTSRKNIDSHLLGTFRFVGASLIYL